MITITRTTAQLATAIDNELCLFAIPTSGGSLTDHYWASSPKFQDDVCVAEVSDFLEAAGYDSLDRDLKEVFELEVADSITEIRVGKESGIGWDGERLATKLDFLNASRDVGSIFEALNPGEFVRLEDGLFKLDADLDLIALH